MAKHFVIIDDESRVVRGFSDDFEQPTIDAICILEDGGRQFELGGVVNPPIYNDNCVALFKFENGSIQTRTQEEIAADTVDPEPKKTLEERLATVEALVSGSPSYGELLEAVNLLLEG